MASMLIPVTIPELGAAGQVLRISAWFVEPGDRVELGDRLLEVLLSGVTCDVTAPAAGRVARLERDLDAEVAVGDIVAWLDNQ